jgi:hypothetical protein
MEMDAFYYVRNLMTFRQDLLPPTSTLKTEAAGIPKRQYISTRLQGVASKTTASTPWEYRCFLFWSEFLATDTEVPGSIPGATRFSE